MKLSKAERVERRVIEKLIKTNIRKKELIITDKEVEFFKENPIELDRITSSASAKKIFLMLAVLLGTVLVALSIIIQEQMKPILSGLITNLMFECGVALFGAAVTVYMLEIMLHRQDLINRQYRRSVLKRIAELEESEE